MLDSCKNVQMFKFPSRTWMLHVTKNLKHTDDMTSFVFSPHFQSLTAITNWHPHKVTPAIIYSSWKRPNCSTSPSLCTFLSLCPPLILCLHLSLGVQSSFTHLPAICLPWLSSFSTTIKQNHVDQSVQNGESGRQMTARRTEKNPTFISYLSLNLSILNCAV